MILGVDVGGTFTDATLFDGRSLHRAKVPTTPMDQSEAVLDAIGRVLDKADAKPEQVEVFCHGMTVGTNALLEERGARTALVTTAGFTDLLEVARQDRPSLYRLNRQKPRPLVDPTLTFGARERCGPEGIIEPLTELEAERVARAVAGADPEAVAICLLFSFSRPEHEAMLLRALQQALPGRPVRASHRVLAQFREFERCSTTVIDAYLAPPLSGYLTRLAEAVKAAGLPAPRLMQSSGGVTELENAIGSGAWSVLSGPAAGAVGAAGLAERVDDDAAIGLDMGGTSCDVCVIEAGKVRRTDSREIDGRVIQLPMVDIETVGAGGGSIAWVDGGGALRVGPRSAGAFPGPACYGHGGLEPTVTDANLILGRLPADEELPGGLRLDHDAAKAAIKRLADRLDLDPIRVAEGILRLADQEMAGAVARMTVERGIDPRRFALLTFGGAGPMHAAGVAELLGITRLICPRAGGVLSAFGLCASEQRRDAARTVMLTGDRFAAGQIAAMIDSLARELGRVENDRLEVICAMRYRGQGFELEVESDARPDPAALRKAFELLHERHYGFSDPDTEIELVTIRVAAITPGPPISPASTTSFGSDWTTRDVYFAGSRHATAVLRGDPTPGLSIDGPAIFQMSEATFVLPAGWSARVDDDGTTLAQRGKDGPA